MQTWIWLGAYAVGFVLLQMYLYRYFIRGSDSGNTASGVPRGAFDANREQETPGAPGYETDRTVDRGPPEDIDVDEAIRCEECGAYNERDQMFVYCRECGQKL
jgi:formylmethanofuran dehydrogenase subunit E